MKTKTVTVRVTKHGIKCGIPGRLSACPIALVIRKFVPTAIVDLAEVFFEDEYNTTRRLPKKAIRFIKRFDAGKTVKPFSFRLKVPV